MLPCYRCYRVTERLNTCFYESSHDHQPVPQCPGAEPRLLGPVGSGLVTADFTAAAQGIQFGIIRPEGAPDIGAYWQIVESGFDRREHAEHRRKLQRKLTELRAHLARLKAGGGGPRR